MTAAPAGLADFWAAVQAWLRKDSGTGGLVALTGDAVGDRRMYRGGPTIDAKLPAVTFLEGSHAPFVPGDGDLGIDALSLTAVDFSAWDATDLVVIRLLDRLEYIARPGDADRSARNPADNMSNSKVRVENMAFVGRTHPVYDDSLKRWSGAVMTEWTWRKL